MKLFYVRLRFGALLAAFTAVSTAADQTQTGAGNATAAAIAANSPLVQSGYQFLARQVNRIQDSNLRFQTSDAVRNLNSCVLFRANLTDSQKNAIVQQLMDQGLVDPGDQNLINGGIKAGVFPPLKDDGTNCPKQPQPWYSAPGSAFGGHHSYPGGLMVHETFNSISNMNFANGYRRVYGFSQADGSPVVGPENAGSDDPSADVFISQDIIVAAPIWHDWTKPMVFQWNADGTEFTELSFGGNGKTDNFGNAGNSKTGGHHIMAIAETMARRLAPDFIIAQASAHAAPTSGNEFEVVNWLRAAAILAQVDPVANGYLMQDSAGNFRLPALRSLGSIDLLNGSSLSHTNFLVEYVLHNLSDSDFNLTGPAVNEMQSVLASVAPQFGYSPADTANYNTKFRNVVLANFSAERLLMLYANGGTDAVVAQINQIKTKLGPNTPATAPFRDHRDKDKAGWKVAKKQ